MLENLNIPAKKTEPFRWATKQKLQFFFSPDLLCHVDLFPIFERRNILAGIGRSVQQWEKGFDYVQREEVVLTIQTS